jgi:formylglycine-generating enzyme required for sulfatase activity
MTADEARALQKKWADHIRQPVSVKNSLGMEMVLIPPGEFNMSPAYSVAITKPYRIATLEVTAAQFQKFLTANPGYVTFAETKPSHAMYLHFLPPQVSPVTKGPYSYRNPGWGGYADDQPISYLTWDDAEKFLTWLSATEGRTYRLPTNAEWVWACRAGTSTDFYWGDIATGHKEYAYTALLNPPPDRPQPVGKLKPNAWGLHDMVGNVAEMVQDYQSIPPPAGHAIDPVIPKGKGITRVLCGGSYVSRNEIIRAKVGWEDYAQINLAYSSNGFRVVLEP